MQGYNKGYVLGYAEGHILGHAKGHALAVKRGRRSASWGACHHCRAHPGTPHPSRHGHDVFLVDPFGITGAPAHGLNWLDMLNPDDPDVVSQAGGWPTCW